MLSFREDILNHVICIVLNSWNKKFEIIELSKTVLNALLTKLHCLIRAHVWNFSGLFFLAFGLNAEKFRVSLRIQSECGKIWIRKAPNTNTFYVVFMDESQKTLPHELRMIIFGNKKIIPNISKLSEKAAYSQFFFP